jgi:protein TonB
MDFDVAGQHTLLLNGMTNLEIEMRISRKLLLAATLTFAATLAAQQSVPVPPTQVPLPPSLRSNSAPPSSVDAVRVSGGVMAGLLVKKVLPTLRECGQGGVVVFHVIIAKDGKIRQLSALSGPTQLYGPVIDAVRQWEYKPYLLNGDPVYVDTTITVSVQGNGCSSRDH